MTYTDDEFGTLRSLLQQPPSHKAFQAILAHLTTHIEHGALEEVWLPYARDMLSTWEDIHREYNDMYTQEGLALLNKHPGITGLIRHLRFGSHTPEKLRELVQNKGLEQLTSMSIRHLDSYTIIQSLRAIFEGTPLKHLNSLMLSSNLNLKDEALDTWLDILDQPHLHTLYLGNCKIGARSLKKILTHPQILSLRKLDLSLNPLGPGGAKAIEKATKLNQLEHLDLFGDNSRIKAQGVEALARSPHLTTLKALNLRDQHIQDEGLIALLESPHITTLERLTLTSNRLSTTSVVTLCHAPNMSHVTRLILDSNYDVDGDSAARAIASSTSLVALTALSLSSLRVSDDAFIELIHSPRARQLVTLCAHNNALTDRSVEALLDADLPSLKNVNLNNIHVSQALSDKLKQRYRIVGMI